MSLARSARWQRGWLVAAAILILAAGLRFYHLDAQSLWNDEGNSAAIAERSLDRIIAGAAADIHPPGYYVLLAGWRALAGGSEFALRGFSALAGVLTAGLMIRLGSRLFDRFTGLLAGALAALNPFQVYYGQEVRMYALTACLAALSILLTAEVLTLPVRQPSASSGGSRPRMIGVVVGYVLVNAAGLYTHYLFPFIILAETLVFLVWLIPRRRRLHGLITWAILQGATLALFLPWLPIALRQLAIWPRLTVLQVDFGAILQALAYGITLPAETAQGGIVPLFLLAAVGLFPPTDAEADRRYLRWHERVGLALAWLVIPMVIPYAQGAIREPTLKLLLPSALALILLAARGVTLGWSLGQPAPGIGDGSGGVWTRAAVIVIAGLGIAPYLAGLWNLYFDPAYARDDYRAIAERINVEAGPEATVVLDAPGQVEVFTYYYPDGPNIVPLPDAHTEQTLADLVARPGRVYAIFWGEGEQDPARLVESTLAASAFAVDSTWYGDVRLVTYAVYGPPAEEIAQASGARFGETIVLDGFTLTAETLSPGDALGVTLFWHTNAPVSVHYKVFVHLYGPDGSLAAQHDSEPGNFLLPTTGWEVRQRVVDNHGVLLPADLPEGRYQLAIGLYGDDGVRLVVMLDGMEVGDRLVLGEIEVR